MARIHIEGQSFLLYMIRKMVAAALLRHTGATPPAVYAALTDPAVRLSVPPAPAAGLLLAGCSYDAYQRRYAAHLAGPVLAGMGGGRRRREGETETSEGEAAGEEEGEGGEAWKRRRVYPAVVAASAAVNERGLDPWAVFWETAAEHPMRVGDAGGGGADATAATGGVRLVDAD